MLFSKVMAGENRSAGYWERAARVLERCIIVCKAAEKCVKLKKYFPANGLGIAKTLFILRDDINKFNKVYYVFDSKEMQWQYARETLYNNTANELPQTLANLTSFFRSLNFESIQHLYDDCRRLFHQTMKYDATKLTSDFNRTFEIFKNSFEKYQEEEKVKKHNRLEKEVKGKMQLKCRHWFLIGNAIGCEVMCNMCGYVVNNEEMACNIKDFGEVIKRLHRGNNCMFCDDQADVVVHSNHSCCNACWKLYIEGICIRNSFFSEEELKKNVVLIKCPARDCKFRYCL
eukprot:TRINITY_DN2237_c0_g2_i14.p1 TRINITY_DN2237_c0_g2~~TRINITY_DN2237_c0_g2_i14.p1  ORF type:complete len:287 (-),score=58.27 TRINITY_DN2237_c0_g2_i14:226-1086(-)